SSPALWSGRYPSRPRWRPEWSCFNPRPLFGAGATRTEKEYADEYAVSILARSLERALPSWCLLARQCHGFNPRPLFGAGATRGPATELAHVEVSILARSLERALRCAEAHQGAYP